MDSTRWDRLVPRDGDIVIATFAKSGTTWMQRIVDLLIFQNTAVRSLWTISPWLDCEFFGDIAPVIATLEAQTHRRFIKSHLPFDALPLYDAWKYIHVVRDGRDACASMHNHMRGSRPEFFAAAMAGRLPPNFTPPAAAENLRDFFLQGLTFMEEGVMPMGDPAYFETEMTYWRERKRENLLFVHYNDLKTDLVEEMARIGAFLGIETPRALLPKLAEAASFEAMKRDGDEMIPRLVEVFDRGADRFINQGTNGRWRGVLKPEDVARYEAVACAKLSTDALRFNMHGRRVAGDPRDLGD
jgi:aryl sulfotransferase